MKNLIYIILVFLFSGCKAQKEEVTIHKLPTQLPLKMEIVGIRDSTYIVLYVPMGFSLKNNNKKILH